MKTIYLSTGGTHIALKTSKRHFAARFGAMFAMTTSKTLRLLATAAAIAGTCATASATLTPSYDTFGALPSATFGGTGIPNSAVAQSTFGTFSPLGGTGTGRLALTAHQRFSNAALTNNGAGRFFAKAGVDQTNATSIAGNYATWNFGFYVDNATGSRGYNYLLEFDVDPTANESFETFGTGPVDGIEQDSWNLGFDGFEAFLGYTFNPTATGEYSFRLSAFDETTFLDSTSIVVQVDRATTTDVPEPGTLALMGAALAGFAFIRRKQK